MCMYKTYTNIYVYMYMYAYIFTHTRRKGVAMVCIHVYVCAHTRRKGLTMQSAGRGRREKNLMPSIKCSENRI
jgi:hypothetical protein